MARTTVSFSGLVSWVFVDRHLLILMLVVVGLFASCGGNKTAVKDFDAGEEDLAVEAKVKKGVKPLPDREVAVSETVPFFQSRFGHYPYREPHTGERFRTVIKRS